MIITHMVFLDILLKKKSPPHIVLCAQDILKCRKLSNVDVADTVGLTKKWETT